MRLYKVYREDIADFDEQVSVVVAAPTAREAREIAALTAGDEGRAAWPGASVLLLGTAHAGIETGLICRDFKAG